jgi:uncharacterized protein (TIGR03086 family)
MSDLDLASLHARALEEVGPVVAGIAEDQWSLPTPCADWDVRTLANHVVAGNWWAAELATGATIAEVGDRLDGDVLGDDAAAAYTASAAAAAAAFGRPGAMDAPCAVSYGPVPGSVYCGHRFLDVLVHGWDLATATGQAAVIDPELAEACLEVLAPQRDALVSSGMFGNGPLPVADDAPAAERLLAVLGRTP